MPPTTDIQTRCQPIIGPMGWQLFRPRIYLFPVLSSGKNQRARGKFAYRTEAMKWFIKMISLSSLELSPAGRPSSEMLFLSEKRVFLEECISRNEWWWSHYYWRGWWEKHKHVLLERENWALRELESPVAGDKQLRDLRLTCWRVAANVFLDTVGEPVVLNWCLP